jgi:hypothetical protein
MPLERLDDSALRRSLEGILFNMRDANNGRTVRCLLTHDALKDVFNASDQSLWLKAFQENQDEIEATASDIFDARTSTETVRVTFTELSQ